MNRSRSLSVTLVHLARTVHVTYPTPSQPFFTQGYGTTDHNTPWTATCRLPYQVRAPSFTRRNAQYCRYYGRSSLLPVQNLGSLPRSRVARANRHRREGFGGLCGYDDRGSCGLDCRPVRGYKGSTRAKGVLPRLSYPYTRSTTCTRLQGSSLQSPSRCRCAPRRKPGNSVSLSFCSCPSPLREV